MSCKRGYVGTLYPEVVGGRYSIKGVAPSVFTYVYIYWVVFSLLLETAGGAGRGVIHKPSKTCMFEACMFKVAW